MTVSYHHQSSIMIFSCIGFARPGDLKVASQTTFLMVNMYMKFEPNIIHSWITSWHRKGEWMKRWTDKQKCLFSSPDEGIIWQYFDWSCKTYKQEELLKPFADPLVPWRVVVAVSGFALAQVVAQYVNESLHLHDTQTLHYNCQCHSCQTIFILAKQFALSRAQPYWQQSAEAKAPSIQESQWMQKAQCVSPCWHLEHLTH